MKAPLVFGDLSNIEKNIFLGFTILAEKQNVPQLSQAWEQCV